MSKLEKQKTSRRKLIWAAHLSLEKDAASINGGKFEFCFLVTSEKRPRPAKAVTSYWKIPPGWNAKRQPWSQKRQMFSKWASDQCDCLNRRWHKRRVVRTCEFVCGIWFAKEFCVRKLWTKWSSSAICVSLVFALPRMLQNVSWSLSNFRVFRSVLNVLTRRRSSMDYVLTG